MKLLLNAATIAALLAVANVAAFVPYAPQCCNFARAVVPLPKPSVPNKRPAVFECNAIRNKDNKDASTDISIKAAMNEMKHYMMEDVVLVGYYAVLVVLNALAHRILTITVAPPSAHLFEALFLAKDVEKTKRLLAIDLFFILLLGVLYCFGILS